MLFYQMIILWIEEGYGVWDLGFCDNTDQAVEEARKIIGGFCAEKRLQMKKIKIVRPVGSIDPQDDSFKQLEPIGYPPSIQPWDNTQN